AQLTGREVAAASNPAEYNLRQWRGPLANGVAPAGNPPMVWSETNNIKWKVKIPGSGDATPIIWADQVFIQTAIGTGKKVPASSDKPTDPPSPPAQAPSGSDRPRRGGGGMLSTKPDEIYRFVLLCLDRKTGQTLWQKTVREELPHEGHQADNGFASYSPVTDGELV